MHVCVHVIVGLLECVCVGDHACVFKCVCMYVWVYVVSAFVYVCVYDVYLYVYLLLCSSAPPG